MVVALEGARVAVDVETPMLLAVAYPGSKMQRRLFLRINNNIIKMISKMLTSISINSNTKKCEKIFLPMRYFDFGTQMGWPHCSTYYLRLYYHFIHSVDLFYLQLCQMGKTKFCSFLESSF